MPKRSSVRRVLLLVLSTGAALIGGWTKASAQERCLVADPTGTPLNVRTTPEGHIVGTLSNGTLVTIFDRSSVTGRTWVYVGKYEDRTPIGWTYRDYLDCNSSAGIPAQASPYIVDGLVLGSKVRFESDAYKQYQCNPSGTFPGFTWCRKEKTENAKGREVTKSNSILHSQDGTAVYVNHYIEPAFFGPNDVRSEIDRLSAKFGERAREIWMPAREGLPRAVIAIWGKIELKQLNSADVSTVASGGSHRGLLVSFLGDLQHSAQAGAPVYELAGGAGFLWAATFNQDGRGVLRFMTTDVSRIALPIVTQNPPALPPQAPSAVPPSTPPPTSTTGGQVSPIPTLSSARSAPGEFARLISKPLACESLRQVPDEAFNGSPQGPVCRTLFECGDAAAAQAVALIEFLKRNPSVDTALRSSSMISRSAWGSSQYDVWMAGLQRRLNTYGGRIYSPMSGHTNCIFEQQTLQNSYLRISSELPTVGVSQGWIGVELRNRTPLPGTMGQPPGAVVAVEPEGDTPAAEAGIRSGDLIVAFNNQPVVDGSDLAQKLREMKAGNVVHLTVLRKDQEQTVSLTLGERPFPPLPGPGGKVIPGFEAISILGGSLVNKVRDEYRSDAEVYRDLSAFNDRYSGIEGLERAYTAYYQTAQDDDVAGMIRERPTFLKELEVAKARRDLLTQQSAQIATFQQRLSDIAASIQHEDLAHFVDTHTKNAIADLQNELQQLSQTAPAKRGDIAANLEALATRIRGIDTATTSARTAKSQAEQIRRTLVENEGVARRVLDAATSPDLTPTFNETFVQSANKLIDSLRDLESVELWAIQERQEDVAAATRKVNEFQRQISDARARYDQAKKLDDKRQAVMQRLSAAFREYSRPENGDKLSTDGVRVITDELKSELDTLSGLDGKPLLARPDYGETLAAADGTLDKIAQFTAEIRQSSDVSSGLTTLINKIDGRGRHLLDAPTSAQLVNLINSMNTLNTRTIPLAPDSRRQLADATTSLGQLEGTVDAVMDREETRLLVRTLPARNGPWQFKFATDKITDEETVQALANAEGTQAKYQLSIVCRPRGPDFLISTFATEGTDSKRIPWNFADPAAYERIRLRIDANPAFSAMLIMHGYGNEGQADIKGEFNNLLHSSRLVFADVMPDDDVEVATVFPPQFGRLCELITPRHFQ